jgi:hypothetical protein
MQREHPNIHPFRLWPKFLASIKNDAEMYDAAIQMIERPQPPKLSPGKERVFHEKLTAAAMRDGIIAKEAEVRRLLGSDQTAQAARLRAEVLMDMRRLAGRITQELAAVSS